MFCWVDVSDDGHAQAFEKGLDICGGAIVASLALREKQNLGEELKGLCGGLMNAGDDDQLLRVSRGTLSYDAKWRRNILTLCSRAMV